jgi:hypothetical protein
MRGFFLTNQRGFPDTQAKVTISVGWSRKAGLVAVKHGSRGPVEPINQCKVSAASMS